MNSGGGYSRKIFLIDLRPTRIFAGMNMNISKSGKYDTGAKFNIASSRHWPNMLYQPGLGIDLDGTVKLRIMVRYSSLKAQHQ